MKTLRLFILALTLIVCMPVMAGLRIDNIIPDPNGPYPGYSFSFRITYTPDAQDNVCMSGSGCANNYHSRGQLCWVADPSATTCDPGSWYSLAGLSIALPPCDTARLFFTTCMRGSAVVNGRGYYTANHPPLSGYWCAGAWHTSAANSHMNIYPGSCAKVGEVALSCSITPPSPLAHGDVSVAGVIGDSAESTATVLCNRSVTVLVRAIASPGSPSSVVPLRADSSITSKLTVNDLDGATGASIPVTANYPVTVNLRSTLASTQPSPGAVQGNAVLVLDVP
nr:hypothetical protein [Luteibacter rhizovicinus]